MYTALYRAFRPETFDTILGQEHIIKILKNQISTGTTGHAYLFCGTRGTGKTSTARILAKGVNCLAHEEKERPCGQCEHCLAIKEGTFIDVVEIDAASHNGVENIRELRESVKYPPVSGRCKVYIIDEVHMLSTGAFNALLKTLEEPPARVMFILATTEVQKLPATILSRCLRLDFKRIPETTLRRGMEEICQQMKVEITSDALGLVAANADGSARDGLSLLDQCISAGYQQVNRETVLELLGTAGEEVFIELTDHVKEKQVAEGLLLLNRIIADGKDVRQLMKDWISHLRNLMMTKFVDHPETILNLSTENVERLKAQSKSADLAFIDRCILGLSQTLVEAKWSNQPRVLLELTLVKLTVDELKVNDGHTAVPVPQMPSIANQDGAGKVAEEKKPIRSQPSADRQISPQDGAKADTGRPLADQGSPPPKKELLDSRALQELWQGVLNDGGRIRGSFNLLRRGTTLKEVGESTFVVEIEGDHLMRYVNDNAKDLEDLMKNHIGRELRLNCVSASGEEKKDGAKTAEDLANEIAHKFNIQIEVE